MITRAPLRRSSAGRTDTSHLAPFVADGGELQALIEEARRRARRRRRIYAASAVLIAAAAAGVFFVARGGGHGASTVRPEPPASNPAAAALGTSGQLTLIGEPLGGRQQPPSQSDGWYGLATVSGRGRLSYLVRCPHRSRWCGDVESLDWSRDGRWLALSVTSYGAANPYNGIHVVDVVTGVDRQIAECTCDWLDLAWSPDGSKLAYVTAPPLLHQIRIVNRDGSHDRVLPTGAAANADAWSPTWSPSGDEIAYATRSRPHREAAVWIQRLAGNRRRLLASGVSNPAWSPNGQLIAVVSRCGGIKLLTPSGRDVTPGIRSCRVIPVSGIPVWSPNGDRLAVAGVVSRQAPYRVPLSVVYLTDKAGRLVLLTRESGGQAVNGRVDASWQPPLQYSR